MKQFLALLSAVLFFASLPFTASADALKLAEGSWGFDPNSENKEAADIFSCGSDPLVISISEDGKTYTGTRKSDQYITARILGSGKTHITLQYDKEERLMGENELQIWTLVLVESDMFVWVLGEPGDFRSGPSDPRYKCEGGVS
jgi:hypothetical protein